MTGRVLFICTAPRKGMQKQQVDQAELIAGHGIDGDAHAGPWHRQISILQHEDIDEMRAAGLELKPGAFGENIVVTGIELEQLGIGTTLRFGSCLLEITQIGKTCHNRCAIYKHAGDCIMPRAGIFAQVIEGGTLVMDTEITVIHHIPRSKLQAAVLTVSDRCAAGETHDTAGPAVADLLAYQLDCNIAWTGIVADELVQIVERLTDLSSRALDFIVTVGGTGCAQRDVTPEATRQVIERELPGLAEKMRLESSKVTDNAWLQRGIAGIRGKTLIVNLPGSRKAATENLGFVIDLIPSTVRHIRGTELHPETEARLIEKPV